MTRRKTLFEQTIAGLRALSEGIDEVVYVADPETYEVLFANGKIKALFKETVGKKCYKAFQNLDSPCPFCTNKHIFGKNLGKTYIWEFQNQKNKHWYRCIDKAIKWVDGRYVRYEMAIDITEQKKTEEALRCSEELFRSIVGNSHDAIIIVDDNCKIIYANDEAEHLSGYSKNEILGSDFRRYLDESNKALVEDSYVRRQKGDKVPAQYNFRLIRKNGEKRDVEIKSTVIKDRCGKIRTIAQLLDITEHQKNEEERKQLEERLSALNKYGQSLNMAQSLPEAYAVTLEAMKKTLGFEYASVLIVEGGMLRLKCHVGYSKEFSINLPLDGKQGITVKAANTGKAILVPDIRKEKAYVCGEPNMLSELVVPIKTGKRVLGALNVESKRVAAFDEEDQKMLEILASHAATAISNLIRRDRLKKLSSGLEYLMKSTVEIMNAKTMHQRLKIIAKAVTKFGWQRVIISLRDENLEGTDIVTAGLTNGEKKLLMKRKASGEIWKERLGPKFERYKIGEFYYLPWSDPWIRKHVHGVTSTTPADNVTTYAGVPSKLSPEEMVDWHPQDMLYAPLRTPEARIVGILSMDDPVDGRKPTKETLAPLELFLHKAAMTIENAQLIARLHAARKQLQTYADKLEQKVEERTAALAVSQQQLLKTQRLAVIGELAGMVGHDLRNPLTSIAGATYYLKKRLIPKNDGRIEEMLELIEKNIAYSNKIINDLLDYSREIKIDPVQITPKSLIKEALSLVEIPKNIRLRNLTKDDPEMKVDAEKLKRAFVNLIKNAVDAMPNGGTLTIKSHHSNTCATLEFIDTGTGMTKKVLKKIWTPLFTTKAKGMGFGLPICHRIVEAHRGVIVVHSKPHKGTTFTITLPIETQTEEEGGGKIWIKPLESSLLTMTRT
ncbi:MAG: PAS domain S-box protein [Candidatus Bathyarchaeota archaeon]|nr:PAS domain S-box protein [Candidatus Bathyarchaeota archaeon]